MEDKMQEIFYVTRVIIAVLIMMIATIFAGILHPIFGIIFAMGILGITLDWYVN
jgi:hypothetical protein